MQEPERQTFSKEDVLLSLRFIFKLFRKYAGKKEPLLAFLALVSAALGATTPFLVGKFIDGLLLSTSSAGVTVFVWLLPILAWFMVGLLSAVMSRWLGHTTAHISNTLYAFANHDWRTALLMFPLSFHKTLKSGEIGSSIGRGSSNVYMIVDTILLGVGPELLSMCIGVFFAFYVSPFLALVILVGMGVYGFVSFREALPIAAMRSKAHEAWNKAFGDIADMTGNYQTVKQAGAEQYAAAISFKSFGNASNLAVLPDVAWVNIRFLQSLAILGTQGFIFGLSVVMVTSGTLSIGELITINGYAALVFGPLATLAMNWNSVQNGLIQVREIQKILTTTPEAYERDGAVLPRTWRGSISFNGVSFAYPDAPEKTVLQNVSFEIKDGQTVALVGESGVGKSTSIELIGGYYYPTAGEVLISGVPTTQLPLRALREQIAVVPQEPVLFNDTVMNNIRFGRSEATDEEVYEAAERAHADEFIRNFPDQYAQIVGERGVKLSVGQKQRIAIARAVLRNPKILILDEPTSALDAKTESKITASLESLMKGRTTIIIAHRLSTVRTADNIIVFEGGAVVEQGTHAALLDRGGVYAGLHAHQVGGVV